MLLPPNGVTLSAVAWDVDAFRTLLVQMFERCSIGEVDLLRVWHASGGFHNQDEGLNEEQFTAAVRHTFFVSEHELWERELKPVIHDAFCLLLKLIPGQNFTRRIHVVHLERWLHGFARGNAGKHWTPVRKEVPLKVKKPKGARKPSADSVLPTVAEAPDATEEEPQQMVLPPLSSPTRMAPTSSLSARAHHVLHESTMSSELSWPPQRSPRGLASSMARYTRTPRDVARPNSTQFVCRIPAPSAGFHLTELRRYIDSSNNRPYFPGPPPAY